jgi:hypothetical protein
MVNIKKLDAAFYESAGGKQPVREWLKELDRESRQMIGQDIAIVEFGWPVGMPVCRRRRRRKISHWRAND